MPIRGSKKYEKIRANPWRLFCVFRGLFSPHKFGQRLSVLCAIFCNSVRAAVTYKKSKKVRFLTRLGGIWISRKYVVYLYREKEILPQRGYLLHFCPIFWVKKGKITRHMRKNMCRIIFLTSLVVLLSKLFLFRMAESVVNSSR